MECLFVFTNVEYVFLTEALKETEVSQSQLENSARNHVFVPLNFQLHKFMFADNFSLLKKTFA